MSPEHCSHILGIKREAWLELYAKYEKGQIEHGGNLWNKGLKSLFAKEIRAEALDLVVYTHEMVRKLDEIQSICEAYISTNKEIGITWDGYNQILTILNGTEQDKV